MFNSAQYHRRYLWGTIFKKRENWIWDTFSSVLAADLSNYSPPRLPASVLYERQEVTLSAVFLDLALPACLPALSGSSLLMTAARGHFLFLPSNHDFAKGRTPREVEIKWRVQPAADKPESGNRREISTWALAGTFPAALSINEEAINRGKDAIDFLLFLPLSSFHPFLFPFPPPRITPLFHSITLACICRCNSYLQSVCVSLSKAWSKAMDQAMFKVLNMAYVRV